MRKILLFFLVIVVLGASGQACFAAAPKKPAVKKAPAPAGKKAVGKKGAVPEVNNEAEAEVTPKKERYKSRSEIKYTGFDAKRDPFCPPVAVTKMLEKPEKIPGAEVAPKDIKLPKVDLQGIIWSKSFPQAIVNGGVLKVGDFIEEFQIKEIKRNGIVLFLKGNDFFIKISDYKKPNKFKQNKKR